MLTWLPVTPRSTFLRLHPVTVDDFIDVIMKDYRKYIKCLYVYNKIDSISLEFLDGLAREPNTAVMSCEMDLGVQDVVDRCWKELNLMRIYTKRYVILAESVRAEAA